MADFDSKLPIRSLAADNTTEIADSAGVTINPAKEDGNLLSIKTNTDKLDVNLSTRLADATFTARINTLGQKTSANSTPVVLASDQSSIPVTIAGNQAVNLTQVGGVAVALGQTTMSASVPVTIASDQTDLKIDQDKVAGTATAVNTGNANAGTQRVVLASDQPAVAVTFTPSAIVELPQYNTASAIAANASSTQTYSPGSTVSLDGVEASASGQMKIEIQYGTTGAEVTKFVLFTSKGDLKASLRLPYPISITNTMSVKVIRTNMDNQAMDVYSTILVH